MERYTLIDHTADVMVKAFGNTLEECYANAGFALFDQTVDLSGIGTSEHVEFASRESTMRTTSIRSCPNCCS